MMIIIIQKRQS